MSRPNLNSSKSSFSDEAGHLRPVIDRTYPLEQTADAVGYAEKQQVRGKVVITVAAA
jgi:NADPH:quinone reductase-like Zn-dependent oxidoreductase